MNSAWTVEFSRILILAAVAVIFGLVSGAWVLAVFLPSAIYIGWTLVQIRTFERWIRLGAKTQLAPDSSGIWQLIVQHIHRTQKKNKQRKKRLEMLARRFEATIAALPDATIVLNTHAEIEWVNQASQELLGIDNKRDIGQRLDNLIRTPTLQALLDSNTKSDPDDEVNQLQIESPVNRLKTLILTSVDFGAEQKLITARDISQRLAVQKLRKTFIANASHELRTPLTVIAGYLELFDTDPQLPENVRQQLSNASQQASRMQKILDDLLTLSKLEESGHNEDSGEIVDMPAMLNKLVIDFQKTKAERAQRIEIIIEQPLKLKASESEIFSLCQNLLSNAVKYSSDDSAIRVRWQAQGDGQVCLQVEDNGEGIAPEHLSRLTERFYRVNVNRSRRVGGTGLGLSIVKHILENHGGYLDIQSELGKGSVFSACFPKYRVIEN